MARTGYKACRRWPWPMPLPPSQVPRSFSMHRPQMGSRSWYPAIKLSFKVREVGLLHPCGRFFERWVSASLQVTVKIQFVAPHFRYDFQWNRPLFQLDQDVMKTIVFSFKNVITWGRSDSTLQVVERWSDIQYGPPSLPGGDFWTHTQECVPSSPPPKKKVILTFENLN